MLEKGLKHSTTKVVDRSLLAVTLGSGDLEVLATPALVAALENAAMLTVAPHLESTETTVGGHIDLKHLSPTALGKSFTVTAILDKVDGKRLDFVLHAVEGDKEIGKGTHTRFIVNRERFMSKL